MIIDDERGETNDDVYETIISSVEESMINTSAPPGFAEILARDTTMHDAPLHHQLNADLIEYIWQKHHGL